MRFDDALFNWLQIQIVADARPDDRAAADTRDFFLQILQEDHGVTAVSIESAGGETLNVRCDREGRTNLHKFPKEAGERLLADINANPKYNE
ncbi:hypothetical protein [Paenibacillus humicola]|uniref:hypothetical protein n=1 Tax=Paenibacillus humicola TaxID=3110540 RepID=UPI00237B90C1|nr:hypothetical protein [Paenibacillus humicola]